MAELGFIDIVKKQSIVNSATELGIGDDCAVLADEHRKLVSVDMLSDGIHFDSSKEDPYLIGRKSLAVSLSDIAAMGGVAKQAFIAININKSQVSVAEKAMQGIIDLARSYDVTIAGGDTNSWHGPLVISTTVVGHSHKKGPVKRSGAKVGDIICVTGPLGGSIQGKHLSFTPRLKEVAELLRYVDINAMIDISDGLAKDLREICHKSSVAGLLDLASIPIDQTIASHKNTIERALCDGEDFELCLTLSRVNYEKFLAANLDLPLYPIGEIIEGRELLYRDGNKSKVLELRGYTHIF